MKPVVRVLVPMLLLAVASASPLWRGETGKIAGTITDKATGEHLPGANIVVMGTALGAASDLNGQYTILRVPPGTYSVHILSSDTKRSLSMRCGYTSIRRHGWMLPWKRKRSR